MSANTAIGVTGIKQTIAALKAFEPELLKSLNKEIRQSMNIVRRAAMAKYPQGGWVVRVNNKKLLGSVGASGGKVAGRWGDSSPGVKAAIFEFAGSRTAGATPQAQGLIKTLNARYGSPGRFLWSAWDEVGDQVLLNIRDAVQRAERDLQASLDSAGEGY